MIFNYNEFKNAETSKMYLSMPGRKIYKPLLGITSANFHPMLNDIWEIDFEIDSVIEDRFLVPQSYEGDILLDEKEQQLTDENNDLLIAAYKHDLTNPIFEMINQYMEICIENLGWFRIDGTPEKKYQNDRYYKTFTAHGYETTLQDLDLNLFVINCGTDESIEMYEENLNALGIPKHNIQLYIEDANEDPSSDKYWKLGLLNILEHEYLYKKGWSIGDIDISLASMRGRQFEIDSKTVYAFLTQDAAIAYRCIFEFDRKNLKINASPVAEIGNDLNIELSLRNVINSINITDQNDVIYNCFRVAGADEDQAIIEYINYGSDRLYNYDYFIETGMIPEDTAAKYQMYKDYLEDNRQAYADYSLQMLQIQEKITSIEELVPVDEVEVNYNTLSLEELQIELESAKAVVQLLEQMHTVDGVLQIEGTPDYAMYISFKEVIIPKIEAEIESRESGEEVTGDEIDWETNWELYGIIELTAKKAGYEESIASLAANGYDKPWDSSMGTNEAFHNKQYQLYQDYQKYVTEIDARLATLNAQVEELNAQLEQVRTDRKALSDGADMSDERWNFTEGELALFDVLTCETDFQDTSIEVLDTDALTDVISLAWDLYDSANEELQIESRPQLSFDVDIDNIFHIKDYVQKANNISMGDFIYLELMNGFKTKQRLIGMNLELVDFDDMSLSFEFSDMVTVYGKASDYRFLLEGGGTSSRKNSISRTSSNNQYIASVASTVAAQILNNYLSGSNSLFPNGISDSDIEKLVDALSGFIDGNITIDELNAKMIQVTDIIGENGFFEYLQSKLIAADKIVAESGEFDELKALVGEIDLLLSGTVSAELGHIIELTAQNVKIDEAVIRDLIAAEITVSMLKAGTISSDKFEISSDDGGFTIVGNTMQFKDKDGVVRIQIGRDTNNDFTFVLYDETGKGVLIDSTGIKESAIGDGLIQTDMVADGAITGSKVDKTNMLEWTDNNGDKVFQVGNMYFGEDKFSTSYTQMIDKVNDLSTKIGSIEIMGENIFKNTQGVVTPASITLTAYCRNDTTVGSWFIDDVENTALVSPDKMSITIPSTYLEGRNSCSVKVTDSTGSLYDTQTIYMLTDTEGADGQAAMSVIITSEHGTTFQEDTTISSTTCTCTVYEGITEIEPTSYNWMVINDDSGKWESIGSTKQITLSIDKSVIRKRLICEVNVDI